MSWVLIVVLGIIALCGFSGWKKGIINIVVSIAALLIAIISTAFLAPVVAGAIKKNTTFYDDMCERVYDFVSDNKDVEKAINDTISAEEDIELDEDKINQHKNKLDEYLEKANSMISLPSGFSDALSDITTDEYTEWLTDGATSVKNIVVKALAIRTTDVIFQAIVYVITFTVIYIILGIVVAATGLIAKLPVINGANKMLGLALGLIEGLIFVWIFFAVLTALGSYTFAEEALSIIDNNHLLRFIYDNNIIMKMIVG